MLPISDTSKRNWIIGTQQKHLVISFPNIHLTLTNENIVSESLSLTEELEQNDTLTFTGCIASRFSFKCNALNQDVRGQRIVVTLQIGTDTPLPLFIGRVDSQDNLTQRDVITELHCYDDLVLVNKTDVTAWYKGLTFPMTVAAFRASFWSYLGIYEEADTLPNDSLQLTKTITDEVILAGSIAKWICQLNARYGKLNRNGNFEYKKLTAIQEGLYPANDLYPAEDLYPSDENFDSEFTNATYNTVNYEPYKTAPITGVYIWDNGGINQGQAGTSGNVFSIADNPLAWGVNMATAAANIFAEIKDVQFIPANVGAIGLPYLETGDIIMIRTDANLIRTYILQRTLNGIQALTDAFRSDSEQYLKVYKESVATMISSNNKSILKIQADIVQMNTLIADRATIGQLNAVNAKIDTLNAKAITTENFTSQKITSGMIDAGVISASKITTGTLSANRIDVNTLASTSFKGKDIVCKRLILDNAGGETMVFNEAVYAYVKTTDNVTVTVPVVSIVPG